MVKRTELKITPSHLKDNRHEKNNYSNNNDAALHGAGAVRAS
jgi:hypothetical protein